MVSAELALLSPLILLAAAGFILPLMGTYQARRGALALVSLLFLLAAAVLTLATVFRIPGLEWVPDAAIPAGAAAYRPLVVYSALEFTPFVALFNLVFLIVAALVVLASPAYFRDRHQGEYYGLLLFATLGMMIVAASRDLITLFVGLELSSFCTYALAGYFKRAPDSAEASVKYFIIGSLSSALTLFGISILYGLKGSVNFASISDFTVLVAEDVQFDSSKIGRYAPFVFAWGFLFAGFGFKIALVPFHNWAPDVYDGSPSTVSAFLAAGSKKMGFAALFKVFLVGLLAVKANWGWMAGLVAILTMTVGNLAALQQTNIKRMLAYSSVAHAGYMLIALPLAVSTTAGEYAVAGGLFQVFTHGIMKAGAFLVVAAVATVGIGEKISDWRGLGRRAPLLAFSMAIFLLSLAGLPPLAGFASKFVLFSAAIQQGTAALAGAITEADTIAGWGLISLAVAGIVNSAISLYYYARVIRVMYVDPDGAPTAPARIPVAGSIVAAVAIAMLATIVIGLLPQWAIELSLDAAKAILSAPR